MLLSACTNLHDPLVPFDITPKKMIPLATFAAKLEGKTCPILVTTDTFSSNVTGEHFKLELRTSCKMSSIIYLTYCRSCGLQYVGETGQALHFQISSHHFNIAHGHIDESPVAAHFTREGHTMANLSIMIIDKCWKEDAILRKKEQIDKDVEDLLAIEDELKN